MSDERDLEKIEQIGMKLDKLESKIEKEEELKEQDEDLSNEIADPSIFQHFKYEYETLDEMEKEIDGMYDQVKEHYDAMLNNRQRGTLNFIQGQTSNLISLKTAKITVVKEKINLKKNIIDFGFKRQLREQDNSSNVGIAMEIMRQLVKSEADEKPEIVDVYVDNSGDDLDEVVEKLEESGAITYSESERNPNAVLNVDKVIRQIIATEPSELKEDNNTEKKETKQSGNLTPIEYMELNMSDEYNAYMNVLENAPSDDDVYEEFEEEYIEDNILDYDIAVGVSPDRQQWKFIAINENGELIDDPFILDQLPDRDCVDMRLIKVNGELVAMISDGTSYPYYTIEFDD